MGKTGSRVILMMRCRGVDEVTVGNPSRVGVHDERLNLHSLATDRTTPSSTLEGVDPRTHEQGRAARAGDVAGMWLEAAVTSEVGGRWAARQGTGELWCTRW